VACNAPGPSRDGSAWRGAGVREARVRVAVEQHPDGSSLAGMGASCTLPRMAARFIEEAVRRLGSSLRTGPFWLAFLAALGTDPSLPHAIEQALQGRRIVKVELSRGDDAALAALASAAVGLPDAALQTDVLSPDVSWARKLGRVRERIDELDRDAVLLIDDRRPWRSRGTGAFAESGEPLDALFAERAAEVADALLEARCPNKIILTSAEVPRFTTLEIGRVSLQDALPDLPADLSAALRRF